MKAVIIANGVINNPGKSLTTFQDSDLIIAADGGANHCMDHGILPAVIVGDMDSIRNDLIDYFNNRGTVFLRYPEDKDKTDLELALSYAAQQGVAEVHLYGLLGGRLDLSLANLLLLARDEWENQNLVVIDDPDRAYIIRNENSISVNGHPGDIISLIAISEKVTGVSTQGLRWQLNQAVLRQGNTRSVSNEIIESPAKINISTGKLILVHRQILRDE